MKRIPTIRAIDVIGMNRMLAARTMQTQIVATFRAIAVSGLNLSAAMLA